MPVLSLEPVDEAALDELLRLAVTEASPEEVVAPLPGASGWNASRKAWFCEYHRTRRAGLDGPHNEVTYSIVHDGRIIGSSRLARAGATTLEAGMWLGRSSRGRGIGADVLRLLRSQALAHGALRMIANTTSVNARALGTLRKVGAVIAAPDPHGQVRATFSL